MNNIIVLNVIKAADQNILNVIKGTDLQILNLIKKNKKIINGM